MSPGWFISPSTVSSSSQQGTGFIFFSLTTMLAVEYGSWAVKNRSSTGWGIRIKKTQMDPRGKITSKKKKSGPGRTISSVYLLLKEKKKSGRIGKKKSDPKLHSFL